MSTQSRKPMIFISYAHADEPEYLAEGEIQWLSFVKKHLRAAERVGSIDIWTDTDMLGGADWKLEIERKVHDCDIFILLISGHSLSSEYIINKEIAIIRQRQASGEDVWFYPLLLTPTPKIALDLVRDKNLRPRGGKPVSAYPPEDREGLMLEAVREIDEIARKIMARKSAVPQRETSEVAITEVVRLVKYSISPVRQPNPDNRNAIVLVHGFSGSDWMSWRNLAPRIASDPRLGSWDSWRVTYRSDWAPSILRIWSGSADLETLATRLQTDFRLGVLARYDTWVMVAHDMGGLLVQKMLVDDNEIASKTHAVIQFGTPSDGLTKIRWLRFWSPQLRDMAKGSQFITTLRVDWKRRFEPNAPFSFLAVAGETDHFVPRSSSIDPFPKALTAVVAGNHISMLDDPTTADLVAQRIIAMPRGFARNTRV
jgi:TIR domain